MEIEVVTPKLNDTGRSEVDPERIFSQINHSTHNETDKEELFDTPKGGSTRESINTNTNNKSRTTKIPATKIVTQQMGDNLVATSERSEGEESPITVTASTSQNVTKRRYQTRSASGITRTRKLKDNFIFKDNGSDEKFDYNVFCKKVIRQNTEGLDPTLERKFELKVSPIG